MSDLAELRRIIEEERRMREEERHLREKAERERDEATHQRDEDAHLREKAERERDEATHQRDEDARLREKAERERDEIAAGASRMALVPYLEACHKLDQKIEVITDPTRTTQGNVTNPVGRAYPNRFIPWDTFASEQGAIWATISQSPSFSSELLFPSRNDLEYVGGTLRPISGENGLRRFEDLVVEEAIIKLVNQAYADPVLRLALQIPGSITFESHTNLGLPYWTPSDEAGGSSSTARPPATPKPLRRGGNRADQFCIYKTSGGQQVPALAIEYKAPHKLTVDEVTVGLQSEVQPDRDVIDKEGTDFAFTARWLTTAVATQLFSYMIGKSLQYGYVCTGQTYVFLYIPDDPTCAYYSVCVPDKDVMDDDESRLHRTAVAQVFAFILRALRATPPSEAWHDAAAKLALWKVEFDDILSKIEQTDERKPKGPFDYSYKPQPWGGIERSPIRTRSGCQPPPDSNVRQPSEDDSDDGGGDPPSPTPGSSRVTRSRASSTRTRSGKQRRQGNRQQQQQGSKQHNNGRMAELDIQSRPYCTQKCLLGLAYGGPVDSKCPNSAQHGKRHRIGLHKFLGLIKVQLATDRGRGADCAPLYRAGAHGALWKVRLTSHGYTLVAKGMEEMDRDYLWHEGQIYNKMRAAQGRHVPVCLGFLDLVKPYHYDCGVFRHFLFLGWAGLPLFECRADLRAKADRVSEAVTNIFAGLHELRVLHRDAEPRNVLYNKDADTFMAIDFERSEFRDRKAGGQVLNNGRKRPDGIKKEEGDFTKELKHVVWKCVASLQGPDLQM